MNDYEKHLEKCAIARRTRITELEKLWVKVTGKDLKAFDRAIMQRFETSSGRDSLSGATMDLIEQGLLEKAKELTPK